MFGQLGLWLSQFTSGYVARVVGDLSTGLSVIALIWLTVYIANYGYVLETGRITLWDNSAALRQNPEVKRAYLGG